MGTREYLTAQYTDEEASFTESDVDSLSFSGSYSPAGAKDSVGGGYDSAPSGKKSSTLSLTGTGGSTGGITVAKLSSEGV